MAESYYTLLGVAPTATADEISAAYRAQRERYGAERVVELDDDVRRVAAMRTAELDEAFRTLSDPERRLDYDRTLGSAPAAPPVSSGLTRREWTMAVSGALVGLLIIGVVWALAGRSTTPDLPPVATINRPASDFTLSSLNGTPVKLSDYRGKVVLLNFWYTSCEPCKEETPALEAAYQRLSDKGLVILGVNVRPNERSGPDGDADVASFVRRYGVQYPVLFDRSGEIGRGYQVFVLPTSLFIDQAGTVRYARFSTLTTNDVEQIFTKLQREASAER